MKNYERNKKLAGRIERVVEKSVVFVRKLPKDSVNQKFGSQYLDAISSFGANYAEACVAESSKDFVHKLKVSLKEGKEALYWLRLLLKANPLLKDQIVELGREIDELVSIFISILRKFKKR